MDTETFELGRNIAATPGKIVFQTDLMQLIQFEPTTEQVFRRPLLIVPPWINKYYVLDLQAKNSFIKWATEQGHSVFVVSWVNPDERLAGRTSRTTCSMVRSRRSTRIRFNSSDAGSTSGFFARHWANRSPPIAAPAGPPPCCEEL